MNTLETGKQIIGLEPTKENIAKKVTDELRSNVDGILLSDNLQLLDTNGEIIDGNGMTSYNIIDSFFDEVSEGGLESLLNINPNILTSNFETVSDLNTLICRLFYFAIKKDKEEGGSKNMQILLDKGLKLDKIWDYGYGVIYLALNEGANVAVIDLLFDSLSENCDVTYVIDSNGWTPAISASHIGVNPDVYRTIIDKVNDVNTFSSKNSKGELIKTESLLFRSVLTYYREDNGNSNYIKNIKILIDEYDGNIHQECKLTYFDEESNDYIEKTISPLEFVKEKNISELIELFETPTS